MNVKNQPSKPKLRTWASVISGSLAATGAVFFTNMPETIKTRMQLDGEASIRNGVGTKKQYSNIFDAYKKIIRQEGFKALQAGLGPAIGIQVIMNGLRLGLFEPIQHTIRNLTNCREQSTLNKVFSGAMSGVIGVTISSPLYLAKNRLQAQSNYFHAAEEHHYKNTIDCLKKIYQRSGIFGLFYGVTAALPRVIVGSATQLTTYDKLKEFSIQSLNLRDGLPAHLFASFISSLFTVTMMNPFDVISTRIYQSSGRQTVYNGVIDCCKKTVRTEGWRALQNGWLALYLRLGPHTIITFVFLEKIRAWFLTFDRFSTNPQPIPIDVLVNSDAS
ncbi:unnamed protein product [Rotaria socialis]|uniref:Mitochondrial carrier protein n=1 Tax=Rotaria socialis TaxID=392032 RepID=A0A817Q3R9_9BILA|nr:unnamed protein product [Rotaria socialis]CAF3182250.1 unnamed protein product [Rotaria socialis]CAF4123565.1 unnamed protein product [Rotaria socialis]CAF4145347.1 unnamed protein product [Rotaria socialis]